jgi:hypothetical protein
MFAFVGQGPSRVADIPLARFGRWTINSSANIGLFLVSGRDFAESDQATSAPVALVNQEFVRRYFHKDKPLDRQFRMGPPPGRVCQWGTGSEALA